MEKANITKEEIKVIRSYDDMELIGIIKQEYIEEFVQIHELAMILRCKFKGVRRGKVALFLLYR